MHVRPGLPGESSDLQRIEVAAGRRFREVDMASIAEDDPPSTEELEGAIAAGRLWVAADGDERPLGYALAVLVDGGPHLEQVSVHPVAQGLGLGRQLVEVVAEWALANSASSLTLTTFRDVEWNRPLYEHLGFVVVPDAELSPALRALRAHEIESGLDAAGARVVMRRLL